MITNTLEATLLPERAGFIAAHPDDTETMLGAAAHQVPEAHVVVASNGEQSTLNFWPDWLC